MFRRSPNDAENPVRLQVSAWQAGLFEYAGMDNQTIFNVLAGAVVTLMGAVIGRLWKSVDRLQDREREMTDQMHGIDKTVAGGYVKREELDKSFLRLFEKLDAIDAKLDSKADK